MKKIVIFKIGISDDEYPIFFHQSIGGLLGLVLFILALVKYLFF